jgi:hypothetical protein
MSLHRKTAMAAALAAAFMWGCARPQGAAPESAASRIPTRTKEQMIELGRQNKTAADLYRALKEEAKGGQPLPWTNVPDWSGVYTRAPVPGFTFDPDQPPGGLPTAKLTPEFRDRMIKRIEDAKRGIEWDPISTCSPPGHPRWLTEPFLREFIVTPNQTWLINEMVNDVRRIYTDGRDHTPEADRYPLYDGDSIGFWDGQKLVIHTNQLRAGIYQRSQPDYTDQVETVEIWQKGDDKTMRADVWVYDPPSLEESWYTKQSYVKLDNDDKNLRIRYWNCGENENNSVIQAKDGATQFKSSAVAGNEGKKGEKP